MTIMSEPKIIEAARAHVVRCSHRASERVIDGSAVFQQDNDTYYRVGDLLSAYDDLRTQLAAAQSEVSYLKGLYEDANGLRAAAEHRAETAEREREALQQFAALQDAWETEAMGDITMLLKERNEYRHRAERLGQQLDAVRSLCDDMQDYTALKVLELLDDASEGES